MCKISTCSLLLLSDRFCYSVLDAVVLPFPAVPQPAAQTVLAMLLSSAGMNDQL
jgi:hypothetical protein